MGNHLCSSRQTSSRTEQGRRGAAESESSAGRAEIFFLQQFKDNFSNFYFLFSHIYDSRKANCMVMFCYYTVIGLFSVSFLKKINHKCVLNLENPVSYKVHKTTPLCERGLPIT